MTLDTTNHARTVLAICRSCGYEDRGMAGCPPMHIPDGVARWEECRGCFVCGACDWEVLE
jgi:hypothetical protein